MRASQSFIDFMVKEDGTLQPKFREGLAWIDGASGSGHFTALRRGEQVRLLEHLAYKSKARPGEETGRSFFSLMRRYYRDGFLHESDRFGVARLSWSALLC